MWLVYGGGVHAACDGGESLLSQPRATEHLCALNTRACQPQPPLQQINSLQKINFIPHKPPGGL